MTTSTLAAVAEAAAGADVRADDAPAPTPPLTIDAIKSDHPDLAKALHEEGFTAGVKAENARIAAIEENALPGHEALIAAHKADPSVTAEASAIAVLKAERANPRTPRETLAALDKAAEGVESRPSASGDSGSAAPKATTPEGWKAEWEASKDLQKEYPTVDAYVAIKKREARAA